MIYDTIKKIGIPCCYSHFRGKGPKAPPYIVYIGNGQNNALADNTIYWRENTYQVEFYFIRKDEALEKNIEDKLLQDGYIFEKSEDVYIEDEDVFVIYYYVTIAKGENDAKE